MILFICFAIGSSLSLCTTVGIQGRELDEAAAVRFRQVLGRSKLFYFCTFGMSLFSTSTTQPSSSTASVAERGLESTDS